MMAAAENRKLRLVFIWLIKQMQLKRSCCYSVECAEVREHNYWAAEKVFWLAVRVANKQDCQKY